MKAEDILAVLIVVIVGAASWVWEGVKSLTLMHWLLIGVILSLGDIGRAIDRGFKNLTERVERLAEEMIERREAARFEDDG